MDGFRSCLFLILICVLLSSPSFAKEECAWSCGKLTDSEKTNALKYQYPQIAAFMAGKASCALSESFDLSNRTVQLGLLQNLAAQTKNCSVAKTTVAKDKHFLMHAMELQGLKLSAEDKPYREKDFEPAQIYTHASALNCFAKVSDSQLLNPGDLLVSQGDAVVIDSVGEDPFGIEARLQVPANLSRIADASPNKDSLTAAQATTQAKTMCEDWLSNPAAFDISVYHAGGRSPFFPTYGKTSSPWVTMITARAMNTCVSRVSEKFAHRLELHFPFDDTHLTPPKPALLVVRHQSDAPGCRFTRDLVPKSKDLECVQCCDFTSNTGVK
jgi:hypothetical protein